MGEANHKARATQRFIDHLKASGLTADSFDRAFDYEMRRDTPPEVKEHHCLLYTVTAALLRGGPDAKGCFLWRQGDSFMVGISPEQRRRMMARVAVSNGWVDDPSKVIFSSDPDVPQRLSRALGI